MDKQISIKDVAEELKQNIDCYSIDEIERMIRQLDLTNQDYFYLLEIESKQALKLYKFHLQHGNKYGFAQWFNGQRALIRKLKKEVKKLAIKKEDLP